MQHLSDVKHIICPICNDELEERDLLQNLDARFFYCLEKSKDHINLIFDNESVIYMDLFCSPNRFVIVNVNNDNCGLAFKKSSDKYFYISDLKSKIFETNNIPNINLSDPNCLLDFVEKSKIYLTFQ